MNNNSSKTKDKKKESDTFSSEKTKDDEKNNDDESDDSDAENFDEPLNMLNAIKNKKGFETILYSINPEHYVDGTTEKHNSTTLPLQLEEYDDALNDIKLKSYLVTIVYDTETSYLTAWKTVHAYMKRLCNAFLRTPILEVHLAGGSVEHHHTLEPKYEKEKNGFFHVRKETHISHIMDKINFKELKDIDTMEYTCALHNAVTMLLYTQNIIDRTPEFIKYLCKLQTKTGKCMDIGEAYDFKCDERVNEKTKRVYTIYYPTRELYLAHTMKELGLTIVGWPHIHIYLLTDETTDYTAAIKDMVKLVKQQGDPINIKITRQKKEPPSPTWALRYISKNHASKVVRMSLDKHYSRKCPIVRCCISERSDYKGGIYKMLKMMSYRPNNGLGRKDNFSSNSIGRNKTTAMEIVLIHNTDVGKYISPLRRLNIPMNDYKLLDPEISKGKYRLYRKLQDLMEEKCYVVCEGMIYQHIKGSKTSFAPALSETKPYILITIEILIDSLIRDGGFEDLPAAKTIKLMATPQIFKSTEDNNIIDFPRISINYRMIEYGDFWFSLDTRKLYDENTLYATYRYHPVKYADLNPSIRDIMLRSIWFRYFKLNGICTVDDGANIFKAVISRIGEKQGSVGFFGESNTNKSTFIKIIEQHYPKHLVGRITKFTGHHIHDQVLGKKIVIVNEVNTILRAIEGEERASNLAVLEGGKGVADQKHGAVKDIDFSKTNLVMTGNATDKDREIFNNLTVVNRINFIHPISPGVCNIIHEAYEDEAAFVEGPLIFIFLAMCNVALLNDIKDGIEELEKCPRPTPEDIKIIHMLSGDFNMEEIDMFNMKNINFVYCSDNAATKAKIQNTGIKFELPEGIEVPRRELTNNEIANALHKITKEYKYRQMKQDAANAKAYNAMLKKKKYIPADSDNTTSEAASTSVEDNVNMDLNNEALTDDDEPVNRRRPVMRPVNPTRNGTHMNRVN